MGASIQPAGKTPTSLPEINVTPFVDVMLVLLIIFMTTASVETTQARQEHQRLLHRDEDRTQLDVNYNQKVPVDLPNVNADQVNLSEEKKMVLSLNRDWQFYIGEVKVLDCKDHGAVKGKKLDDEAFRACLMALGAKLDANEKIKRDKELYLRADENLPYGRVLQAMSRVRAAGVTRFGLIAEPEK